jgi:2-oxoglutarate/2-oxoacid ferredoxin oxidoreductase subunit beta
MLTRKDFQSEVEVRWCPGCGDYSILAQVQKVLAELGAKREENVFVSGIGCSSRFPYYMNTYGFHTIHGRAPAVATGLKLSRPELQVWVVTGDGDALAIGGNHFIHAIRRNIDLKILLFNNRIYGLTKGQYSPTSEMGKATKSTPFGSLDRPFNPLQLAIGAGATFVARAVESQPAQLQSILSRAAAHRGTAVVEILTNCVVFNDGTFDALTAKQTRDEQQLRLVPGEPLLFANGKKAIGLAGLEPEVLNLEDGGSAGLPRFSETLPPAAAFALAGLASPTALGVLRAAQVPTFDALDREQQRFAREAKGVGDLAKLLTSAETWRVES